MLKIRVWDEISDETATHTLDLPPDCRDGRRIGLALDAKLQDCIITDPEEGEGDGGWELTAQESPGPGVTLAHYRSDRGHRSIITVLAADQEPAAGG